MLKPRILLLPCLVLLSCLTLSAQTDQPPAGLEQMLQLLDRNGIKYDRAAVESGAIDSALLKIDPGARVQDRSVTNAIDEKSMGSETGFAGGIRCFVINGFFTNDSKTVVQAIREAGKARGLIIDLRSAGGNDYAAAAEAAGVLRQSTGTNYSVVDLRGNPITNAFTHAPAGSSELAAIPVVIINDNYTADAAEFFAALLKNRPGVVVSGDRTSGDAYIRGWTDLDAGRIVYLPYARIIVTGCDYAGVGVTPDLALDENAGIGFESKEPDRGLVRRYTSDSAKQQKAEEGILSSDRILRKAVDVLHAVIALESREKSGSIDDDEDNKNKGR